MCMHQVTEVKQVGTPVQGSKLTPKQNFIDPLSSTDPLGADGSVSLAFEGPDPLSRFAAEAEPVVKTKTSFDKVQCFVICDICVLCMINTFQW